MAGPARRCGLRSSSCAATVRRSAAATPKATRSAGSSASRQRRPVPPPAARPPPAPPATRPGTADRPRRGAPAPASPGRTARGTRRGVRLRRLGARGPPPACAAPPPHAASSSKNALGFFGLTPSPYQWAPGHEQAIAGRGSAPRSTVRRSSTISWSLERPPERRQVAVERWAGCRGRRAARSRATAPAPPGSAGPGGRAAGPFAKPGTNTVSNSRPLAWWIVITLTESSSARLDRRPLLLVRCLDRIDVVEERAKRQLALERREARGPRRGTRPRLRRVAGPDRGRGRRPARPAMPDAPDDLGQELPDGLAAPRVRSAASSSPELRRAGPGPRRRGPRPRPGVRAPRRTGTARPVVVGVLVAHSVVLPWPTPPPAPGP